LRQVHLVDGHKDGRWMYYCLPGRNASKAVKQAIKLITDNLGDSLQTQKDDEKLKKVLKTDKEVLCKKQMAK
ncbi:MAG: hypothetical protein MI922_01475, partial [Bacteroidales bacterium]|nr:hypothetical protein [Bacteroidales bacterium]